MKSPSKFLRQETAMAAHTRETSYWSGINVSTQLKVKYSSLLMFCYNRIVLPIFYINCDVYLCHSFSDAFTDFSRMNHSSIRFLLTTVYPGLINVRFSGTERKKMTNQDWRRLNFIYFKN